MEDKRIRLICIGSSSLGNSYALDAENEILLLEAGVKMAEVKRFINYRMNEIVGVCVSHAHG